MAISMQDSLQICQVSNKMAPITYDSSKTYVGLVMSDLDNLDKVLGDGKVSTLHTLTDTFHPALTVPKTAPWCPCFILTRVVPSGLHASTPAALCSTSSPEQDLLPSDMVLIGPTHPHGACGAALVLRTSSQVRSGLFLPGAHFHNASFCGLLPALIVYVQPPSGAIYAYASQMSNKNQAKFVNETNQLAKAPIKTLHAHSPKHERQRCLGSMLVVRYLLCRC